MALFYRKMIEAGRIALSDVPQYWQDVVARAISGA